MHVRVRVIEEMERVRNKEKSRYMQAKPKEKRKKREKRDCFYEKVILKRFNESQKKNCIQSVADFFRFSSFHVLPLHFHFPWNSSIFFSLLAFFPFPYLFLLCFFFMGSIRDCLKCGAPLNLPVYSLTPEKNRSMKFLLQKHFFGGFFSFHNHIYNSEHRNFAESERNPFICEILSFLDANLKASLINFEILCSLFNFK